MGGCSTLAAVLRAENTMSLHEVYSMFAQLVVDVQLKELGARFSGDVVQKATDAAMTKYNENQSKSWLERREDAVSIIDAMEHEFLRCRVPNHVWGGLIG